MKLLVILLMVGLLTGCAETPPSGEVVARVDGIDITRRDVGVELQFGQRGREADTTAHGRATIDAIIDRVLLAREAERNRIEQSPAFLGAMLRDRQELLANGLIDRILLRQPSPTPLRIARFVRDNSWRFADRRVTLTDRIEAADCPAVAQSIGGVRSADQAISVLTGGKCPFRRGLVTVDTQTLQSRAEAKAATLTAFTVSRLAEQWRFDTVVVATSAPVVGTAALKAATVMMDQAARQANRDELLAALRKNARIKISEAGDSAP